MVGLRIQARDARMKWYAQVRTNVLQRSHLLAMPCDQIHKHAFFASHRLSLHHVCSRTLYLVFDVVIVCDYQLPPYKYLMS